jgi:dihydrolipoamide dehydrogenase
VEGTQLSKSFDVIVIAGMRAMQLGFNVACIDEWRSDKGGPAPRPARLRFGF